MRRHALVCGNFVSCSRHARQSCFSLAAMAAVDDVLWWASLATVRCIRGVGGLREYSERRVSASREKQADCNHNRFGFHRCGMSIGGGECRVHVYTRVPWDLTTVHAGWPRGRGPARAGWSCSSFVHPSPLDLGNSSLLCVERVRLELVWY